MRLSLISIEENNSIQQKLPTFENHAFQIANSQLAFYLASFEEQDTDLFPIPIGIIGKYGSGKTHLVSSLMHRVYESKENFQQIYSKAESSSFLTLYHQIIKQIAFEKIQHINTIWLSEIAQRQAKKYSKSISSIINNTLKENPNFIYRYFNDGLISESEVERIQSECIRNATHEEDFVRAISYLTNSTLEDEAYNWLLGKNLSSNTLRKLGLTGNIDNPELAKIALRFLATFFAQAHQPLFLYIDQIEYLLLNTSTEEKSINIGTLQSLVEIFAKKNCFLCLSGLTEAWNILPENFFSRILSIEIPKLLIDESFNLMKTYLSSSDEVSSYKSEEDIYPYTKASVSEILRLSDGNIRRFLHLAHETFEQAAPNQNKIEVEQVKEAAKTLKIGFSKRLDSSVRNTESPTASTSEIEKLGEKLSEEIQSLFKQLNPLLENRSNNFQKLEQQFSNYIKRVQYLDKNRENDLYKLLREFERVLLKFENLLQNQGNPIYAFRNLIYAPIRLITRNLRYSRFKRKLICYFLIISGFYVLLLLKDSEIFSSISHFLGLLIKVLTLPLTLGIIAVLSSSIWLFYGVLNTWNRRKLQKQTIRNIERYKKDSILSYGIPREENKLVKSSKLNNLVLNPLKYGTPFFVSIGTIYAFNIFSSNITLILAIAGGLLSPFLFLRIPSVEQKKND